MPRIALFSDPIKLALYFWPAISCARIFSASDDDHKPQRKQSSAPLCCWLECLTSSMCDRQDRMAQFQMPYLVASESFALVPVVGPPAFDVLVDEREEIRLFRF